MRVLSKEDAVRWCGQRGVPVHAGRVPEVPSGEEFQIPNDAGARIALVARHLGPYSGDTETLVWFTNWGVWSSGERPHIFTRFLASYGETRPLSEAPAFLFETAEFEDAVSFVTLGVLFLWDVFVLSGDTGRRVQYSHDEWGMCLT
jgi:hypothetical protein